MYDQLQHLPSHADPNIDMSNLLHTGIIKKKNIQPCSITKIISERNESKINIIAYERIIEININKKQNISVML